MRAFGPVLTFPPGRRYRGFDARVQVPRPDGTLLLPSWLSYECATAETSAQTGAATVRTGFAPNAPRAFSRDGSTWGMLVWKAMTNLVNNQDFTTWVNANSPVVRAATTPAGTTENCEVEDDDLAATEYKRYTFGATPAGTQTLSTWMRNLEAEQTLLRAVNLPSEVYCQITSSVLDADWVHRSTTGQNSIEDVDGRVDCMPRSGGSSSGACRYWGMQLEEGAYPSPFMGADNATFSCVAGKLTADPAALVPRGRMRGVIVYRPHYSNAESGDHRLVHVVDSGDLQLASVFWQAGTGRFVLAHPTGSINVSGNTFSRHQELLVYYEYSAERIALEVRGATTGNGRTEAAADSALAGVAACYVLGGSAGADEGADLRRIAPLST